MDTVLKPSVLRLQIRDASPLKAFRFRFPLAAGHHHQRDDLRMLTSQSGSDIGSEYYPGILSDPCSGTGRGVSVQSMTVTIQALRSIQPTLKWYLKAFGREFLFGGIAGGGIGASVGMIVPVMVWECTVRVLDRVLHFSVDHCGGHLRSECADCIACPAADPKVAAGPVTLSP